jgi:hypothetical protein
MINLMKEYWGELAQEYQIDTEGYYVTDELFHSGVYLEIEMDEEYLDWEIQNIESWIDEARKDYVDRTRRFAEIKMADQNIYRKHFPAPGWSNESVQERSSSGVSLFYGDVSVSELMDLLWESLACTCPGECKESLSACDGPWRRLLSAPHLKLFVQAQREIGASHGQPTEYVCFDFDCATPLVHAYPIGRNEIPVGEILVPHVYAKTWKDAYIS